MTIEPAPGGHRLGHGTGGSVRAFLVEDGGGLSFVDTVHPLAVKRSRVLAEQRRG